MGCGNQWCLGGGCQGERERESQVERGVGVGGGEGKREL